jgi:hypothetical protein
MRFLLLSTMILIAGTTAHAEDLPQNAVITNRSSHISINEVKTVKITNDKTEVQTGGGHRVISVNAALEIGLNVEGNLCGYNARDVFMTETRTGQDQSTLSLSYKYRTNPFSDILSACTASSAPRDVTVALRLYDSAFDAPYERTFSLALSYDLSQIVLVKVRYDDSLGLVATIVP